MKKSVLVLNCFLTISLLPIITSRELSRRTRAELKSSIYSDDVSRIKKLLSRRNNAILIGEEIDLNGLREIFEDEIAEEVIYLNLEKLTAQHSSSEIIALIEQALSSAKNTFLINQVDLFLEDETLKEKFKELLLNRDVKTVGITDFAGYRKLEQDLTLSSSINFVLERKALSTLDKSKKIAIIGASAFLGQKL